MFKYQNVWFINFCGIGNGIVVAPILRCFENSYPSVNYYHTENPLLSDPWFVKQVGLRNLKGFSPATWRRFKEEDWEAIESFIREKKIELIVNLRNEGPRYDIGYYKFKENASKKGTNLDFWDLDFDIIERRMIHQNLTGDILALFKEHDIDFSDYSSKWLESICKNKDQHKNIGFGMAASQANKRWPTAKWIELASFVIKNSNQNIVLFPGASENEKKEAERILEAVGKEKCKIIHRQSFQNVALQIGELLCFVSNDTGLLHLAAAINISTVGLYVSTDSEIWSPYDKTNFVSCQNSFINKCPDPKSYCGNCFHYYDTCPAIARYGDDINPSDVYEIVSRFV